jgi:hypothetical protein
VIAVQKIFYDFRSGPTTGRKNFKREERAQDGRKAMIEYEAQAVATRKKTARLKALRLAKEAQARNEPPPPKLAECRPTPRGK